jgi:putative exosortase-associated protein (TIGR04073 family)
MMRRALVTLPGLLIAVLLVGCAGPERKLGRGMMNVTELGRGGELRRSMEQTHLWEGPEASYTIGMLRGLNRSIARTFLGAFEIVTFPLPPYDPLFTPERRLYPDISVRNENDNWGGMRLTAYPMYPENYRPAAMSDSIFFTDTSLGFSGGDIAPMVPGSRFRIFE